MLVRRQSSRRNELATAHYVRCTSISRLQICGDCGSDDRMLLSDDAGRIWSTTKFIPEWNVRSRMGGVNIRSKGDRVEVPVGSYIQVQYVAGCGTVPYDTERTLRLAWPGTGTVAGTGLSPLSTVA
jgi:hypothetical protein